jgi:hypothetical protein
LVAISGMPNSLSQVDEHEIDVRLILEVVRHDLDPEIVPEDLLHPAEVVTHEPSLVAEDQL